jgi:hypothetical protein
MLSVVMLDVAFYLLLWDLSHTHTTQPRVGPGACTKKLFTAVIYGFS